MVLEDHQLLAMLHHLFYPGETKMMSRESMLGKSEFKQIRNEEIFYTKNMNK